MKADTEVYAGTQRGLRGPGWRWLRAQALAGGPASAPDGPADPQVRDAAAYLRLRAGGPAERKRAARKFPHIAAAERLAKDGERSGRLKVLVLGGCPAAEVAARASVDPATLSAWEALFFDVRGAGAAADWVLIHVVRPEEKRGDAQLAARLKFACAGGPAAARAALDAEDRLSLEQGETLFDRKVRLHLKFAEAAEVLLDTDRKKLFFIKLHATLMDREQRLRLAERRLAQQCEEALRKQAAEEERLEQRRLREAGRAARAAEREARRAQKEEVRRALVLQRAIDATARAQARQERKQAAKERGARSALGQLRWECSAMHAAVPGPERLDAGVPVRVKVWSGPGPQGPGPEAEAYEGADGVWQGGDPAPERIRCRA